MQKLKTNSQLGKNSNQNGKIKMEVLQYLQAFIIEQIFKSGRIRNVLCKLCLNMLKCLKCLLLIRMNLTVCP